MVSRVRSHFTRSVTPKFVFVWVLVVVLFGALAGQVLAGRGEETKWTVALVPCLPLGEDDAGGEAEYESESSTERGEEGLLKVEIDGATRLSGETLEVEVDGRQVGRLTLDENGRGFLIIEVHLPGDPNAVIVDVEWTPIPYGEGNVYSSDPDRC